MKFIELGFNMSTGNVFNIQKYSIHDGPGIRTTIFFKGCPLNCWWCHNPESQSSLPELIFWKDRCILCKTCITVCPSGALSLNGDVILTDKEKCTLCGECVQKCPTIAREIIGKKITVEEVMEEIEKDRVFYQESGGGVTFSGGEPLFQQDFLEDLLRECHQRKIHTTLDTSGYCQWTYLYSISRFVDLFLYDVKIMNDEAHIKYTGISNQIILGNLKKLSEKSENIIIRIPVIPDINDDIQNVTEIGEFLKSINADYVELLSYHNIASEKYARIGKTYALENIRVPDKDKISEISTLLQKFDLTVKTGG